MLSSVSLVNIVLADFVKSSMDHSEKPNLKILHSFELLLTKMEDCLKGLPSDKIIVASIDPGLGKSYVTILMLKHFHRSGYATGGSVLICLSTKEEIAVYAEAIGLSQADYAVVTADKDLNAQGCDVSQHNEARIMFTTQQMVKARANGVSMEDLTEFHFQGRKRSLVIWDESLDLEEWSLVSEKDLAKLRGDWPRTDTAGYSSIKALEAAMHEAPQSGPMTVPADLENLTICRLLPRLRPLARRLRNLAGEEVSLVVSSDGQRSLVYQSATLPKDLHH